MANRKIIDWKFQVNEELEFTGIIRAQVGDDRYGEIEGDPSRKHLGPNMRATVSMDLTGHANGNLIGEVRLIDIDLSRLIHRAEKWCATVLDCKWERFIFVEITHGFGENRRGREIHLGSYDTRHVERVTLPDGSVRWRDWSPRREKSEDIYIGRISFGDTHHRGRRYSSENLRTVLNPTKTYDHVSYLMKYNAKVGALLIGWSKKMPAGGIQHIMKTLKNHAIIDELVPA